MKLFVALLVSTRVSSFRSSTSLAVLGLAIAGVLAGGATLASADAPVVLDPPAEGVGDPACPDLVRIRYPFLKCPSGQIGIASGDDTWENSRQLPLQEPFLEGDGYFGPELNTD